MPSYNPPLNDALGTRYPVEELTRHGVDPDTRSTPAVYCLRLCVPRDFETLRTGWYESKDVEPPPELTAAVERGANGFYVGAAKNLLARLEAHKTGDHGASFAIACPPHSLAAVWAFDDALTAFQRERGLAIDWREERPGAIVVCNGDFV